MRKWLSYSLLAALAAYLAVAAIVACLAYSPGSHAGIGLREAAVIGLLWPVWALVWLLERRS